MGAARGATAALAGLWARHLASPLPRCWLGPFGGRLLRACRPREGLVLLGPPDAPVLRHWSGGRWRQRSADPLELLEERARSLGLRALGYVAYEYGHMLEEFPPVAGPPSPWPLLSFHFFDEQEELLLPDSCALSWPGSGAGAALSPAGLRAERPPESFRRGVRRIREWIRAGDCYQVNLVQGFRAELRAGRAAELFSALRRLDGGASGYRALLEEREGALVCDSPELFLERRGRRLRGQPIKGTARLEKSSSPEEAREEAMRRLLASGKERAELAMIVDLLRNDLSRVCEAGSVSVGPLPEWISLPTLQHSCASVTGRLRPGVGLSGVFRAAFPCGSISGCPRRRAQERIVQLEPGARGPCFGALGRLEPSGDFLFNVAIRTALLRKGELRLLAGGGITVDSRPAAEEAESRWKVELFGRALVEPL